MAALILVGLLGVCGGFVWGAFWAARYLHAGETVRVERR